ncbi:MAG: hypothetical protein JXM71_12270, partial [Spirochaetales bacterium]|nr:hypothetical protein [Spirochaetales bacterium]
MRRPVILVGVLLSLLVLCAGAYGQPGGGDIRLGVLAKRGKEQCHAQWDATAAYLSERVPGYRFVIVPLNFDEVAPAVA